MTKDVRSAQTRLEEIEVEITAHRGLKSITLHDEQDEERAMRCEFRWADDDGKNPATYWLQYEAIKHFAMARQPLGLDREEVTIAFAYHAVLRGGVSHEVVRSRSRGI